MVGAGVLVQVLLAAVGLVTGHRPPSMSTFLAYLVATPLVVPFAAFLSIDERSRWGSLALCVGLLTTSALLARLLTLWGT